MNEREKLNRRLELALAILIAIQSLITIYEYFESVPEIEKPPKEIGELISS